VGPGTIMLEVPAAQVKGAALPPQTPIAPVAAVGAQAQAAGSRAAAAFKNDPQIQQALDLFKAQATAAGAAARITPTTPPAPIPTTAGPVATAAAGGAATIPPPGTGAPPPVQAGPLIPVGGTPTGGGRIPPGANAGGGGGGGGGGAQPFDPCAPVKAPTVISRPQRGAPTKTITETYGLSAPRSAPPTRRPRLVPVARRSTPPSRRTTQPNPTAAGLSTRRALARAISANGSSWTSPWHSIARKRRPACPRATRRNPPRITCGDW